MNTLNLNAKPLVVKTFVFGADLAQVSQDQLIALSTSLAKSANEGLAANKDLDSNVIAQQVATLKESVKTVIALVDSESKLISKTDGNLCFDLEKPCIETKSIIFGLYEKDLTQDLLISALKELQSLINEKQAMNKDIDSKVIKAQIETLISNKETLRNTLDNLETK